LPWLIKLINLKQGFLSNF